MPIFIKVDPEEERLDIKKKIYDEVYDLLVNLMGQSICRMNDPSLQNQITTTLENHFKQAGIVDYKIVCDETNNTPEHVASSGYPKVDISFTCPPMLEVIKIDYT